MEICNIRRSHDKKEMVIVPGSPAAEGTSVRHKPCTVSIAADRFLATAWCIFYADRDTL